MNKYKYLILLALIAISSVNVFADKNIDLAKRYLKLGNSYRQAGEYKIAEGFINKAGSMLKGNSFESQYWTAVSYEYLGFVYCDRGQKSKATSAILAAIAIYDKIIKLPDGSQEAAKKMLKEIEEKGCPCYISDLSDNEEPGESADDEESDDDFGIKGDRAAKQTNLLSRDYSLENRSDLPADLPSSLENIGLSGNKFESLPNGLSRLKKLKFVDLSSNNIKDINGSVSDLKSVQELILNNNKIKSISDNICSLKNLRVLDIRNNPLQFNEIKRLIQCMPNTLIYHDKFQKVEEEDEDY